MRSARLYLVAAGLPLLILAGGAIIRAVGRAEFTSSVARANGALDEFERKLVATNFDTAEASTPDIFGGKEQPPLRYDHVRGVAWSSGPDLHNDDGRIQYDPTNGVISRGDLIRRVRRAAAK